jgi:hypothetical protein
MARTLYELAVAPVDIQGANRAVPLDGPSHIATKREQEHMTAEAVTGKTMREDLVQATVQPAAVGGSVTYSPEQVAIVKASIDREVWECSGIELSDDALDSAAHAAIQNFLLLHRSDERTNAAPDFQRQNETDSLRLQVSALVAALTETAESLRMLMSIFALDSPEECAEVSAAMEIENIDALWEVAAKASADLDTARAALTAASETGVGK